jgi:membrane fusion protein, heavy metal efflux system
MPVDATVTWCKDHGVHACPLCNPAIIQARMPVELPGYRERVSEAFALRPRAENVKDCQKHQHPVQFGSAEAVEKAGIDVAPVEQLSITETISAVGEITYDQTKLARVATRVPGTVARVLVAVGDRVEKGDVIALVDAAEVGKAKADLLDALSQIDLGAQNVARLTPLKEKQIIPGIRLLEAQTALEQSRISAQRAQQALANLGLSVSIEELRSQPAEKRADEIQFLGIPEELRRDVLLSANSSNLVPLTASLTGTVIECSVVDGEVIDPSQHLFELADTDEMWLSFNVALEDAHFLRKGQEVRFQPDGRGQVVEAKIDWISTEVNDQTRTVAVRATVPNPDGRLRNETFGQGQVVLRENPDAVVVPTSAIHNDGNCSIVFVRDKRFFDSKTPKFFHTRTVRLGATKNGNTEILAGVWPGEVIATKGGGVLRSQLLKASLGAGCTCHH